MTTIKTVAVDLTLNSKDFKAGLKEVDRAAETTGKKISSDLDKGTENGQKAFERMQASANKTVDVFKKLAVVTAAAVTTATGFAIKSAADFQQTRIGIENMLGSADAARDTLKEISDIAAKTPFEFAELADSARQLLAFGFNAEDAVKTMTSLGDVSAAIGAPIGDLSYLMGTLRTQGRAFTIDIRQFAQRGIPIYEYLAKTLGKSEQAIMGMIEEGKIGFPEVEEAFKSMTGEGGKFYQTMDKQSESFNGRVSTLKDNIGILSRRFVGLEETGDVVKGGLFDKLSKGIEELTIWIEDNQETVNQWATDFTNFVTDMWDKISAFIGWVAGNKDWLLPLITGLVALKAALDLTVAFATVSKSFGILAATISMPIVMPAIAIGAALGAIAMVWNEYNKMMAAIEGAKSAADKNNQVKKDAIAEYTRVMQDPNSSEELKSRWKKSMSSIMNDYNTSSSGGGGWATGGFTGRGGRNEVAGIVHRGEYVLPQKMVDQNTGTPKMGGIENHIGTINISSEVDGEKWLQRLTKNQETISRGLVPTQRYA